MFYVSKGETDALQTCFFFLLLKKQIHFLTLNMISATVVLLYEALLQYTEPTGEGTIECVFSELSRPAGSLPADALFQINQFYIFLQSTYLQSCSLFACTDS